MISILVAVIIMISFYAISRSVAIDDQRKAMGYLQESSNYRTIQQEIKKRGCVYLPAEGCVLQRGTEGI